jgi:hypothetical protein
MSTVKYRMRASQRELGPYRRHELLTGEIFYPQEGYSGYANGTDTDLSVFISDEMRADWRSNRTELMKFWRSGEYTTPDIFSDSKPWLFICGSPGTLPRAAKIFDRRAEQDA